MKFGPLYLCQWTSISAEDSQKSTNRSKICNDNPI